MRHKNAQWNKPRDRINIFEMQNQYHSLCIENCLQQKSVNVDNADDIHIWLDT